MMSDLQKQIDGRISPEKELSPVASTLISMESDALMSGLKDPHRHIREIKVPPVEKLRDQNYNFFEKYLQVVEKNAFELQKDKKTKNLFEDMLV